MKCVPQCEVAAAHWMSIVSCKSSMPLCFLTYIPPYRKAKQSQLRKLAKLRRRHRHRHRSCSSEDSSCCSLTRCHRTHNPSDPIPSTRTRTSAPIPKRLPQAQSINYFECMSSDETAAIPTQFAHVHHKHHPSVSSSSSRTLPVFTSVGAPIERAPARWARCDRLSLGRC